MAKWRCPDEPGHAAGNKINAETRARHEAKFLAGELRRLGPSGLGATDWSTWSASDWISDIVPRTLFGLSVAYVCEILDDVE